MADQGSIANLKQNINENIYDNTDYDISGGRLNTVLQNVVDTLNFNGRDFFNVNEYREKSDEYADAAAGRNAVPDEVKKIGLVITYLLADGWYMDQFIGSNISGWSTASNWKVLGPVSVSQNTSTGGYNLSIGSNIFGVVSEDESIYFKDSIPTANKRMTELYLVGLDSTKRYYFRNLGQYYNGNNYAEIHVILYSFTQDDKSDQQKVCSFVKTDTSPMSVNGIVELTEYNSSGVHGWAVINITTDTLNDVTPEIDIDVCANLFNSPILAGLSPATKSSFIKATEGNLIAEINGVRVYSGNIEFINFLDQGNSRLKELYIYGDINAEHTYRLLTFSTGNYVGVNLYDQTDNNKLVCAGSKSQTSFEGLIKLTERNSSGINAYAFVKIGADAADIYGIVNMDYATDLNVSPIIKNSIAPDESQYFKYKNADVSVSLYQENKYVVAADGSFASNTAFSIIKIDGTDLRKKITILNVYAHGYGVCGIGAYKSDGTYIRSIFTLPNTELDYYNYYLDLSTPDYDELGYILLSVSKLQILDKIVCLVEQYKKEQFYFALEPNVEQEIKETHIYLKADGTTPKLAATLIGITDNDYYNRYIVHLAPGTYDILDGVSHVQDPATNPYGDGVWLKDYVSIVGDGERDNTIIKCEMDPSVDTQTTTDSGYTVSIMEEISTINASSNSTIENVTITAKNCRYAIHSDYSHYQMENTELKMKNCKVIHYGDTSGWSVSRQVSTPSCYGGGIRNGQKRIFENCVFIAYQNVPWFTHNASTMDRDAFIDLISCEFLNLTESITPTDSKYPCVKFASYGVTPNVYTRIIGCIMNTTIELIERTLSGHTTKGTDYVIVGNGNNAPIAYKEKDGTTIPRNNYCIKFSDDGIMCVNGTNATIPLGTCVKLNDNGTIVPLSSDEEDLLFGVTNQDIVPGESGFVKTKGYYSLKDLGVSSSYWGVGNKFIIDDSAIVPNSSGNIIATRYGYIILK